MEKQPNHANNIPRLNCVAGQIEGIKKMIQDERYCLDIITQIKAVRATLKQIECDILEKHLRHCVVQSFCSDTDKNEKINELVKVFMSQK